MMRTQGTYAMPCCLYVPTRYLASDRNSKDTTFGLGGTPVLLSFMPSNALGTVGRLSLSRVTSIQRQTTVDITVRRLTLSRRETFKVLYMHILTAPNSKTTKLDRLLCVSQGRDRTRKMPERVLVCDLASGVRANITKMLFDDVPKTNPEQTDGCRQLAFPRTGRAAVSIQPTLDNHHALAGDIGE